MSIPSSNAYYAARLEALLRALPEEIIGALVSNSDFSVEPAQRNAWLLQIQRIVPDLIDVGSTVVGFAHFEFNGEDRWT